MRNRICAALIAAITIVEMKAVQLLVVNDTADPIILKSNAFSDEQRIETGDIFTFTEASNIDFLLTQLCDNKPRAKRHIRQTGTFNGTLSLPVSDILLQEPETNVKESFTIEEIK